jgi:hypothetical protein
MITLNLNSITPEQADTLIDIDTHREAWTKMLQSNIDNADNDADHSYYEHELHAFNRLFNLLTAITTETVKTGTMR